MVTETAQFLCSVHWILGSDAPYKATHRKHPIVLWACESLANYKWACDFGMELAREYTHRYGRTHATEKVLLWLQANDPPGIESLASRSEIPLCMPDPYKGDDPVLAHRMFYVYDKARFCKWTKRAAPLWFQLGQTKVQEQNSIKVNQRFNSVQSYKVSTVSTAKPQQVSEALEQQLDRETSVDAAELLQQNEERDKPILERHSKTSAKRMPTNKRRKLKRSE